MASLKGPNRSVRIGREYYESSGYFEEAGPHLIDPESPFQKYRVREVLKLCGEVRGARALDLGCGWGTISFALAESAAEVVGVDFAEASLSHCRSRLDPVEYPNIRFLRADVRQTGLPGAAWDLAVAADLIEHMYPEATLGLYREVLRLLRPGGRFVIWTPSPTHFLERLRQWRVLRPDPTHVDYKSLARVKAEVESIGFEVIEGRHVPSHLPGLRTIEAVAQRWFRWLRRRVAVVAVRPEPRQGRGESGSA